MRPAGIPKSSRILPCWIFVFLGLLQTSYYALTSFGTGISLTFHLLARALTVERTVIGRPPSQCCQMYDNYPPNTIILSLLSQNFVAGEGAGSSACENAIHYPAPSPATKCPFFSQTQIWSPYVNIIRTEL